jgi:hypothetical protein
MESVIPQNIPSALIFISGLIQLAILIWIFVFPIIIIKKLKEIAEILKHK